ncbi:MAG TPA: hypothetical protein VM713_11270, partial [Steroidobacteraceae bacterium]|nr:hypothetical protein [Steroidobacteraceae bacterium]
TPRRTPASTATCSRTRITPTSWRATELAEFNSWTLGVGASYEFSIPHVRWIHRSTANIRYDHMTVDYKDFRNALLAAQYGAGNEPLYKLDANILEAFLSVWY